ncbi:hypothetical protein [Paracoccus sp. SSK6]|uniref:hypothetical protein n=1 Tax=Paracoccus sp. SSK6 TaxID=3143131 RepID=UPI00321B9E4D
MPLEIHALMQEAQDFHGRGRIAPEEDDMAVAGHRQKAGPQFAAIPPEGRRLRQDMKGLVKLRQVSFGLTGTLVVLRVKTNVVKVRLGLMGKPEAPGHPSARSFASDFSSE